MVTGVRANPLDLLHATGDPEQLQELADKLKRQLKDIDQNENIQKAILVSKVYEDIIKALKETEVAANQAL
ncbi:unnamed protein product [Lampetra fluviatilis]